jgi:hypothetical protein
MGRALENVLETRGLFENVYPHSIISTRHIIMLDINRRTTRVSF